MTCSVTGPGEWLVPPCPKWWAAHPEAAHSVRRISSHSASALRSAATSVCPRVNSKAPSPSSPSSPQRLKWVSTQAPSPAPASPRSPSSLHWRAPVLCSQVPVSRDSLSRCHCPSSLSLLSTSSSRAHSSAPWPRRSLRPSPASPTPPHPPPVSSAHSSVPRSKGRPPQSTRRPPSRSSENKIPLMLFVSTVVTRPIRARARSDLNKLSPSNFELNVCP